jgi:pyrroline-5-carboxylate reductase
MADVLIVGGGKMGEALLGGLLAAGRDPSGLAVVEPVASRRDELAAVHGVRVLEAPEASRGVILATKPDVVAAAAASVARAGVERVLSVAAGVTLASLGEELGASVPTIRAMPNTPALVGQGAAAICGNAAAGEDDVAWAEGILGAVGTVVRVGEAALDAVTGLSGSGPAYVFLVAEALIDAGVMMGLTRPIASELAVQTLLGAATLLTEGRPPAELRADVTSPAFADAVEAATLRSRKLGRS